MNPADDPDTKDQDVDFTSLSLSEALKVSTSRLPAADQAAPEFDDFPRAEGWDTFPSSETKKKFTGERSL